VESLGKLDEILKTVLFILVVFTLVAGTVFGSIVLNVHLHELGHYVVAEHYGLQPHIHISGIVEHEGGLRFNMNPRAHTTFVDPHDVMKNIAITIAGPLVNILLTAGFMLLHLFIKRLLKKKIKTEMVPSKYWKLTRTAFFVDMIFLGLIIPSLVSAIVNLSNITGSDGAFLRELLKQL
jgi:Zn-dependent protease